MAIAEFVRNILKVGSEYSNAGQETPQSSGNWGDANVSQFLPPSARLALDGKLFIIDMSGGTAIAPVTAAPVASPQWGLYNNSLTETMIVLAAAVSNTSGTTGLGLALMGAAAIGVQTAVTADYAGTIKSQTNGQGATLQVFLDSNPTLIGGTPGWFAFEGTRFNGLAAVSLSSLIVPVNGALVAPPSGHMVAFEVVSPAGTTPLYDMQFLVAMVRNN